MPNVACLYGPPFSLVGDTYFDGLEVSFQVSFDNAADWDTVLKYEWFLDDVLLLNEEIQQFDGLVITGPHQIGVRILTGEGWSGVQNLDFYANINSIQIQGPDSLDEGQTAVYKIILSFLDGSSLEISDQYIFTASNGGTFIDNTFYSFIDDTDLDDKQVTITATPVKGDILTKQITLVNITPRHPGILVVDIYHIDALNVIGFIANEGVSISQVKAYTGQNVVPNGANPPEAYILASDLVTTSALKWRFEFNIAKLIAQYPNITDFVFEVKGRAAVGSSLIGAFSLKSYDTKMTLQGSAGTYVPAVIGGSMVGDLSNFETYVVGGANGDYAETVLQTIIRFNFNVPTDTITYTTPPPVLPYHFKSSISATFPTTMKTGYTSGNCAYNTPFNASSNNKSVVIDQTNGTTFLNDWGASQRMFKIPSAGTYRFKAKLIGSIICNNVGGDARHWQTIRFLLARTGANDIDLIPLNQNSLSGVGAGKICLPGQYVIAKGLTVPFNIDFALDIAMNANDEAIFKTRINLETYHNQQQGANETNTTNFQFSLLEYEVEKIT